MPSPTSDYPGLDLWGMLAVFVLILATAVVAIELHKPSLTLDRALGFVESERAGLRFTKDVIIIEVAIDHDREGTGLGLFKFIKVDAEMHQSRFLGEYMGRNNPNFRRVKSVPEAKKWGDWDLAYSRGRVDISANVIGWGLASISDLKGQHLFLFIDIRNRKSNISPQLAFCGIFCHCDLGFSGIGLPFRLFESVKSDVCASSGTPCRDKTEDERNRRNYFLNPPIGPLLSLMLALFGVPTVLVGLLGRSSFAYGLVLVIIGGVGIVAGVCCGLLWSVSHNAENASVFCGSVGVSATRYRGLENVVIGPVIIPELKFRDVQRQIFAADLVKTSHDAALQERPKTVDCLRVNDTINILFCGMPDDAMVEIVAEVPIAGMLIGRDETYFLGNRRADERVHSFGIGIVDDASNNVALATDSADHDRLSGNAGSGMLLIPMAIAVAAADIGFVNFDDAAKLGFRFDESGADFVAHGMCGAVAAEAHHTLDLKSADPFFAGEHQMHDLEPLSERLVRVLKDGASNVREAIGSHWSAFIALPVKLSPGQWESLSAATWALDAIRPAARDQVNLASLFVGKGRLELSDCHLVNWLGAAAHGVSSQRERNIAWQI
jgi:hypothetical protein